MSGSLLDNRGSVACAYPGCTAMLRRAAIDVPQFCSKNHRDGEPLYEVKFTESFSRAGWHIVKQRTGSGSWEVVASVFGVKRAEIVRDAFSAEANARA